MGDTRASSSKRGLQDEEQCRTRLKRSDTHFKENFAEYEIDNVNVENINAVIYPQLLLESVKVTEDVKATILENRSIIKRIVMGDDPRLLVVVGPCSIHDPKAAIEYANLLAVERRKHAQYLHIVMRVYFEKPRTTVGWKGLINDPYLDNSFRINSGLLIARELLLNISQLGLGVGCEFLDSMIPQYIADLVSWGAIGARTTECQLHRELASGLSMPVGFKNGTSGDVDIAVDALRCAQSPHAFLGITKQGLPAIVKSKGNNAVHLILRGGKAGPNYSSEHIRKTVNDLSKFNIHKRIIVDCSHGNSMKDHKRQALVVKDLCQQIRNGETAIGGLMIESNLNEGNQELPLIGPIDSETRDVSLDMILNGCVGREALQNHRPAILQKLKYGVSVTDKCIGWEETVELLDLLADTVKLKVLEDTKN